jgi:hypothetical protein
MKTGQLDPKVNLQKQDWWEENEQIHLHIV